MSRIRTDDMAETKVLPQTPLEQKIQAKGNIGWVSPQHKTKIESWRAFSLRWPYQLFLLVLTAAILAVTDYLRRISDRDNGIVHFVDPSEITSNIIFAYNFLPAIIGAIYSVLWSYIDADAKRLEPYYQLKSERASIDNLFLDYIFRSPFIVPFAAFKRRHWMISMISALYLLIALVLPASHGAFLRVQEVLVQKEEVPFLTHLYQPNTSDIIQGEFLDQAKRIMAGEVSLPPWTTSTHTIVPFNPLVSRGMKNETWIASSNAIYAEFMCQKIDSNYTLEVTSNGKSDDDIKVATLWIDITLPGCDSTLVTNITFALGRTVGSSGSRVIPISNPQRNNANGPYPRVGLDPRIEYAYILSGVVKDTISCQSYEFEGLIDINLNKTVHGPGYPERFSNKGAQVVILSCKPSYYSALADIQVKGNDEAVVSVGNIRQRKALDTRQFNGTSFHRAIQGLPRDFIIDQGDLGHSVNMSISDVLNPAFWRGRLFDTPPTVVLAKPWDAKNITSSRRDQYLLEGNNFKQEMESLLQLMSALAFRSMVEASQLTSENATGVIQNGLYAITVNPIFAIISEILLSLAAIVLLISIFVYARRHNILQSDPDSIAAQLSLLIDLFSGLSLFDDTDVALDQKSTLYLESHWSKLKLSYSPSSKQMSPVLVGEAAQIHHSERRWLKAFRIRNKTQEIDRAPFFFTTRGFVVGILALLALISAVFVLLFKSLQENGFHILTLLDTFNAQLLWSFLPTLIATCLESCWITVSRDVSALEPFFRLRKGNATPSDSMALRYASRPPSLALYLSFRNRHAILCFTCLLCISTSALNVLVAGMFLQSFASVPTLIEVPTMYTNTTLSGIMQHDPYVVARRAFWLAMDNINSNTPLPPWTTPDRFYVPPVSVNLSSPSSPSFSITYNTTTIGLAAELDCTEVPKSAMSSESFSDIYNQSFSPLEVNVWFSSLNNSYSNLDVNCGWFLSYYWSSHILRTISAIVTSDDVKDKFCSQYIGLFNHEPSTNRTMMYICEGRIDVQTYTISYSEGKIISSHLRNALEDEAPKLLRNTSGLFAAAYKSDTIFNNYFLDLVTAHGYPYDYFDYDIFGILTEGLRSSGMVGSIPEMANAAFARYFAAWLSLIHDDLLEKGSSPSAQRLSGSQISADIRESRIVASVPLFAAVIFLLILYLAGYAVLFIRRRNIHEGPRMPKTIGSLIPWVIHSRMLEDFQGLHYMKSTDREKILHELGMRYGFGMFEGTNGKRVLGIDYSDRLISEKPISEKDTGSEVSKTNSES